MHSEQLPPGVDEIDEISAPEFSHGLCADCLQEHYPEIGDEDAAGRDLDDAALSALQALDPGSGSMSRLGRSARFRSVDVTAIRPEHRKLP